jgi:hypothetical protein
MQTGASEGLDDKKWEEKGEIREGLRIRRSYFTVYNFWKYVIHYVISSY